MEKTNPTLSIIYSVAYFIIRLEWLWVALMIVAYWLRSPPFREQYIFLLGVAVPIYGARWIVHRRLFTRTPLDITFATFAILSLYNFHNAPVSRSDYWALMCRPFLGIFLVYYFVETVRQHKHMRYVTVATIFLGILLGILALVASQWGASDKSDVFAFIIDALPVLDYRQVLPDMQLSFNPNEIAGALAYFCPFLLAVGLGTFVTDFSSSTSRIQRCLIDWVIRWGAIIGFLLVATALILGQSRFGMFGVFIGIFMVIIFISPNWKFRMLGLSIWGIVVLLEIMLVANVLPLKNSEVVTASETQDTETVLNERDERTLSARFDLWERALRMVTDYPTTGAGMSTYRALVMREAYMIPMYEGRQFGPPHAHNALFQFGADLGMMGLALFVAWYTICGWMTFQTYQKSTSQSKLLTIAISSGILAYIGYGIGDTITFWDRFAFLHWWFIGLITSVYILQNLSSKNNAQSSN